VYATAITRSSTLAGSLCSAEKIFSHSVLWWLSESQNDKESQLMDPDQGIG
jgi:hypothetical protein